MFDKNKHETGCDVLHDHNTYKRQKLPNRYGRYFKSQLQWAVMLAIHWENKRLDELQSKGFSLHNK